MQKQLQKLRQSTETNRKEKEKAAVRSENLLSTKIDLSHWLQLANITLSIAIAHWCNLALYSLFIGKCKESLHCKTDLCLNAGITRKDRMKSLEQPNHFLSCSFDIIPSKYKRCCTCIWTVFYGQSYSMLQQCHWATNTHLRYNTV